MSLQKILAILGVVIGLIGLVVGRTYWVAAHDEVFYLCGNFSQGVEEASVIRQLNTAELSSYSNVPTESGSRVVFSSDLFFVPYQCVIELDSDSKVIVATFE